VLVPINVVTVQWACDTTTQDIWQQFVQRCGCRPVLKDQHHILQKIQPPAKTVYYNLPPIPSAQSDIVSRNVWNVNMEMREKKRCVMDQSDLLRCVQNYGDQVCLVD